MSATYIFVDESGKPEIFSQKGTNLVLSWTATRFLVFAAIRTNDQLDIQKRVQTFKLELFSDPLLKTIFSTAYTLDSFHATKDYPQIQERMCHFITTLDIKIDVIVVEKLKTYPILQRNPERLYGVMAGHLLKNITHLTEKTEIIFSRKDSKLKLREQLETEVERIRLDYIQKHPKLSNDFSLSYHHNPHYTHAWLQIADYVAYAVFKHYEQWKDSLLSILLPKIWKIQDVCNKKYFSKTNLLELSS